MVDALDVGELALDAGGGSLDARQHALNAEGSTLDVRQPALDAEETLWTRDEHRLYRNSLNHCAH